MQGSGELHEARTSTGGYFYFHELFTIFYKFCQRS